MIPCTQIGQKRRGREGRKRGTFVSDKLVQQAPRHRSVLSLSFSSSSSCPASSSLSSSTTVVVAFLPAACAHAPSSKRDVWVYISRTRVYRTPTMYVCTREWRYSYAIRFRAKRKRSCSKRRGVFTISLETRRNLEKGTVPNHWETSYPLVASLSFRISSAFSKSGEEEVVKDLVSCSINIYNRASYPISSVLYKYSRGRIDSRCSSLCEKLVLPFALVPFFSFFFCFVFFCFWERYMPIGASISKNYWPRIIERTFPVIVLPGRWDKIDCQRRFLSPAISMNGWWLATEIARGKSG